ncbi:MAG: phosphate ABC transporter permease subunit PstC [Hyphomicrobiales bacterium]|nr:MAG: phosphate ABC transporter permease subunit PstC [Hyphomicrobiales bacterium]
MSAFWVLMIILCIGAVGYFLGAQRAQGQGAAALADRHDRNAQPIANKLFAHSLPRYHGWLVFIFATIPALLVLLVWSAGTSYMVEQNIRAALPAETTSQSLVVGMVHRVADALDVVAATGAPVPATLDELRTLASAQGVLVATEAQDYMIGLASAANRQAALARTIGAVVSIILALGGAAYAFSRIRLRLRARNQVESVILWTLLGASTIAILTTVGIVLSMLSETIHFFSEINPVNFFFGTVWDPRFAAAGSGGAEGQFGLIPLLAGTLYIAFVSMLFAVPVGLMAAVYMGEYASPRVRATVKPLLELLAGIPTIVYGIFAMVTLGPFLRDLSAALAGGTPFIQAQSVLTAGLVMGVMLIPVVSSLSDDVITAVPRAMRDGSLALGATRSETITKVILPAALPGIVGALLLTASRAIGETMIVVLAAGVAARLTINPFEAMTTITVKIVNQLTGDLEFNSPQTLVAFALGLTLFVLTLCMNVYALYIVRKYREQYE